MKANVFSFTLALISMMISTFVHAQPDQKSAVKSDTEKSYTQIGIRYTSDFYYMGRSDSSKVPYLTPSIRYYHRSGLFIGGGLSYLTAEGEGRIDLFTLTAGYAYWKRKIGAGVSLSSYFFNDDSYAVQAEMKNYLNAFIVYDLQGFLLYGDASAGFSEETDLFVGAEISRALYALKNRLQITPAIAVNFGSQQYYNQYYSQRSTQTGYGKGKGMKGMSTMTQMQVLESEKFQVLDYETSIMVSYRIQQLRFFVSGTWTFPVNPSTMVINQETYEEDLDNGFYWSTGVRLRI